MSSKILFQTKSQKYAVVYLKPALLMVAAGGSVHIFGLGFLVRAKAWLGQFFPSFWSVSFHCCDNGWTGSGCCVFALNRWHLRSLAQMVEKHSDGTSWHRISFSRYVRAQLKRNN
jgi:hypothetical protein